MTEQTKGAKWTAEPHITARAVATEQGVASEVEYTNEHGAVIGFWAYGHFAPRYPYQGEDSGQQWSVEPWEVADAQRSFVVTCPAKQYDVAVVRDVGNEDNRANAHRIVACVNAMQGIGNPESVAELVEAAKQSRAKVQAVLQRAYNSGGPVCCHRPVGGECCGSPDPEWSDYDQQIMTDLGPIEKALTQALAALEQEPTNG